jgi:hypothetical protein
LDEKGQAVLKKIKKMVLIFFPPFIGGSLPFWLPSLYSSLAKFGIDCNKKERFLTKIFNEILVFFLRRRKVYAIKKGKTSVVCLTFFDCPLNAKRLDRNKQN